MTGDVHAGQAREHALRLVPGRRAVAKGVHAACSRRRLTCTVAPSRATPEKTRPKARKTSALGSAGAGCPCCLCPMIITRIDQVFPRKNFLNVRWKISQTGSSYHGLLSAQEQQYQVLSGCATGLDVWCIMFMWQGAAAPGGWQPIPVHIAQHRHPELLSQSDCPQPNETGNRDREEGN